MRATREVYYCDDCGEMVYQSGDDEMCRPIVLKAYRVYPSLPWDVASANAGESGVVCFDCAAQREPDDEGATVRRIGG